MSETTDIKMEIGCVHCIVENLQYNEIHTLPNSHVIDANDERFHMFLKDVGGNFSCDSCLPLPMVCSCSMDLLVQRIRDENLVDCPVKCSGSVYGFLDVALSENLLGDINNRPSLLMDLDVILISSDSLESIIHHGALIVFGCELVSIRHIHEKIVSIMGQTNVHEIIEGDNETYFYFNDNYKNIYVVSTEGYRIRIRERYRVPENTQGR